MVALFQYLGRTLMLVDKYWPAVVTNLWNLWKAWSHLSWILGKEGSDAKKSGPFYIEVVQANLIFWSETWVVTHRMAQTLEDYTTGWRDGSRKNPPAMSE